MLILSTEESDLLPFFSVIYYINQDYTVHTSDTKEVLYRE